MIYLDLKTEFGLLKRATIINLNDPERDFCFENTTQYVTPPTDINDL